MFRSCSISDRWMNGYGALMEWYLWENWSTGRKVCPTATFSTTNPIWTGPGLKPCLHCENAVTNCLNQGMQWHSWLRHCATSRKVVGLVLNGVTEIFHWYNPSSCTVALGLVQPLTEMSKGKAVPLQAWTGPEGSRKLGLPDFVTPAQDSGRLSTLHTGCLYTQEIFLVQPYTRSPLPPRKYSWYSFLLENVSTQGQQKWIAGMFPGGYRRLVRRADTLTTFMCRLSWNLGASNFWNPQGMSRPVMGLLYLLTVWTTAWPYIFAMQY